MTREDLARWVKEEAIAFTNRTGIRVAGTAQELMVTKASPYLPSTHQEQQVREAIRSTFELASQSGLLLEMKDSTMMPDSVQAAMNKECKFLGWC